MSKKTIKAEVVIELLKQFPNAYSKPLARMLFEKYPQLYKDVEDARTMIRYYRGSAGQEKREKIAIKEFVKEEYNPYGIPNSDAEDYPDYHLPKHNNKVLILNDLHLPYHSVEAVNVAIDRGVKEGCNTVVLNGDIADYYSLSRWEKDPRNRHFALELDILKEYLDILERLFSVFYKLGNHEERYQSYLRTRAPELIGVSEFEFSNIMKSRGSKAEFIYKQKIYLGKLPIIHGHEYGIGLGGSVNTARSLFLKTNKSSACGHSHRTSEHTETDIDGKTVACWSIGCLCDLHPEYAILNKWNHGFATCEFDGNGDFEFKNYRIINGKVR